MKQLLTFFRQCVREKWAHFLTILSFGSMKKIKRNQFHTKIVSPLGKTRSHKILSISINERVENRRFPENHVIFSIPASAELWKQKNYGYKCYNNGYARVPRKLQFHAFFQHLQMETAASKAGKQQIHTNGIGRYANFFPWFRGWDASVPNDYRRGKCTGNNWTFGVMIFWQSRTTFSTCTVIKTNVDARKH